MVLWIRIYSLSATKRNLFHASILAFHYYLWKAKNMKRFTLHLEWHEGKEFRQVDKIESDDLIHLLTQLNFVLISLKDKIDKLAKEKALEEQKTWFIKTGYEDDIPF